MRDYINVVDLAKGHFAAADYFAKNEELLAFNLRKSRGYSLLEMVKALQAACQHRIEYSIVDRCSGDIACCYADIPNWRQKN